MMVFSFLSLAASLVANRPALAIFCQSAAAIAAQAELCEDNEKFARAAENCRNEYLAAVKAEQERLGKTLRKGVGDAKSPGEQHISEGLSAGAYEATMARIDSLLRRGEGIRSEQMDYIAHFLPPFHWPQTELGPMPRRNDPALWKAYDGEFCFGEHKETIDHMVKDVDQAVEDLRKARKEAQGLKAASLTNKTHLVNGAGKPAARSHGDSAHGQGAKSSSGQSDITGIEQDQRKKIPLN